MRVSQKHRRIAKRGVIADEILVFHKKKKVSKSIKCFRMNRSFGCITVLRCEENRCTFLTLTKVINTPETSVYFFGRHLLLSGIFCNETITSSSI